MIFLRVSDPSATLPVTLVNLPAILEKSLEPVATTKGVSPGSSAPAPGAFPMLTPDMGQLPGDSSASGAPSAPQGAAQKTDAAKVPTPEALRKYLFPGETVMASDENEIRLTTRSAFPNINPTILAQILRQLNGQLNPPQVAPGAGGAGGSTPGGAGGSTPGGPPGPESSGSPPPP
jgi:hypothetical protein